MRQSIQNLKEGLNLGQIGLTFAGTIATVLIMATAAVGFDVITPTGRIDLHIASNDIEFAAIDQRVTTLEVTSDGNADILRGLARRVCIIDTREQLQRSGLIVTCTSLGINKTQ